jgi:hypothetical protein
MQMVTAAVASTAVMAGWAAWGPERGAAVLPSEPHELAALAVSEDPVVAAAAATTLRSMGASGLDAVLAAHATDVRALRVGTADREAPGVGRLRSAIDTVAAQRDAHASGLYWHTDLELAKAEARRRGRPILSLRLLGRLDEELSCANSRLFRTVLYPDPGVGSLLRDRFVLHWSSERPAPKVTIDMGDGRTITRTITGNSVHYVLDAQGRPVDALPGLYTPREFERALRLADRTATGCGARDDGGFRACVADAHRMALTAQQRRWETLRTASAGSVSLPPSVASLSLVASRVPGAGERPLPAIDVDRLTISKSGIERPMLRAMQREVADEQPVARWWTAAGATLARDASLSAPSRALLRFKTPDGDHAAIEAQLTRDAAEDSARNEYVLHRRVHEHFASTGDRSFASVNGWVYATLFLTPAEDPWLGLRDSATYDAIER